MIIPPELAAEWGAGHKAVRGTIAGKPFRGSVSRGEGVLRMAVPAELRELAGVRRGDTVEVEIERDTDPRPWILPIELREVFAENPGLEERYKQLPPSQRRAWAAYIDAAKQPETRIRRARQAPGGIRARKFPG